jgi:hypothetical protein
MAVNVRPGDMWRNRFGPRGRHLAASRVRSCRIAWWCCAGPPFSDEASADLAKTMAGLELLILSVILYCETEAEFDAFLQHLNEFCFGIDLDQNCSP